MAVIKNGKLGGVVGQVPGLAGSKPLLPVTPGLGGATGASVAQVIAQQKAAQAPLPPDPVFDARRSGLATRRDQTIAGLQAGRKTALLDYGYTEQPGGGLQFDASNPYSRMAQMQLRFDQSRRGATNSYAARGQLYSGALQNARDEINRQQGVSQDSLLKALGQFLAANSSQQAAANTEYELGVGDAEAQRVARAQDNPLYQPALPAPAPAPAPAPVAPAAPAAAPPVANSKVGLGNNVSVVNGRFLYKGRELSQKQWDMLNRGLSPWTGHKLK